MKAAIYMRFGNEPQEDEERSCGYTRKNIFEMAEIIEGLEREWNLHHSRKKS